MERIDSDTHELAWHHADRQRGVVTVDTARSQALIGFVGPDPSGSFLFLHTSFRYAAFCGLALTLWEWRRSGDGRFLVGTSKLGDKAIFRPAFSNWRTRQSDVDEFVTVLKQLGPDVARSVLSGGPQ